MNKMKQEVSVLELGIYVEFIFLVTPGIQGSSRDKAAENFILKVRLLLRN